MIVVGVFFFAAALLLVTILQIRAYFTLKRQNKVITEQSVEIQKQNQILARQNQQLNQLNVEKHQIIGVVSHDLKGPFNRIFALIQLVKMSGQNLTEDQREYISRIHQVSTDGLGMVRNLLDSRQLEEKEPEMEIDSIPLAPFVTSFIKNYQELAEEKAIKISARCPSTMVVETDRLFLYRVLDNIVSNAIKFSPSGSEVAVTVEGKNDRVNISIKDQGPGISEEDQKKLYRKFQRLTAKPTAGESSTGLGLSIVKSLVDKMGGTIDCQSELGSGTTFMVSLKKR